MRRRARTPGLIELSDEELRAAYRAVRYDLDDRYHPDRNETALHSLKEKLAREMLKRALIR